MIKEDFEQLNKLAADALNEIANEDFDRADILKIGQLLRINKTFFDIARQLTRIADAQEQIMLLIPATLHRTPAPDVSTDALVEAVVNIKAALVSNAAPTDVIYALQQTLKEKGDESVTVSPSLLIPLLEALAAHETGVR